MKVTEYDVILARAGKFNLSHEEVEKMVVCCARRHNLGIYWRPRKSCQYPDHKGKKIAPHCKTPINWQMAQEIRKIFVTFVKVGSRKYLKNLAIELGFRVGEVYKNLLAQRPIYYDAYNLCDLHKRKVISSFNVEMLKSLCKPFGITFKAKDRKRVLVDKLTLMLGG